MLEYLPITNLFLLIFIAYYTVKTYESIVSRYEKLVSEIYLNGNLYFSPRKRRKISNHMTPPRSSIFEPQ